MRVPTFLSRMSYRRLLAFTVPLVLAFSATHTLLPTAAHAAALTAPTSVAVEVEIDPALVDASDLRRWVEKDTREALDALPSAPPRRGSIRVSIAGALYDYQITLTALRDGEVVGTPNVWGCECSSEELLQKLREELPKTASALEVEEEPPEEPEAAPAPAPVTPLTDDRRKRGRLGPAGSAGVALMVVGATGVAAGVTLMVLDTGAPGEAFMNRQYRDLPPVGGVLAGTGVGVLATGLTLYLLRGRRNQPSGVNAFTPSLDERGHLAVTLSGSF